MELTYPLPTHFWVDDFPFLHVGYVIVPWRVIKSPAEKGETCFLKPIHKAPTSTMVKSVGRKLVKDLSDWCFMRRIFRSTYEAFQNVPFLPFFETLTNWAINGMPSTQLQAKQEWRLKWVGVTNGDEEDKDGHVFTSSLMSVWDQSSPLIIYSFPVALAWTFKGWYL